MDAFSELLKRQGTSLRSDLRVTPSRPTWCSCQGPLHATHPDRKARPASCTGSCVHSLHGVPWHQGFPSQLCHLDTHLVTSDTHHFFPSLFCSLQNGHDSCLLGSDEEVEGQVTPEAAKQRAERRRRGTWEAPWGPGAQLPMWEGVTTDTRMFLGTAVMALPALGRTLAG